MSVKRRPSSIAYLYLARAQLFWVTTRRISVATAASYERASVGTCPSWRWRRQDVEQQSAIMMTDAGLGLMLGGQSGTAAGYSGLVKPGRLAKAMASQGAAGAHRAGRVNEIETEIVLTVLRTYLHRAMDGPRKAQTPERRRQTGQVCAVARFSDPTLSPPTHSEGVENDLPGIGAGSGIRLTQERPDSSALVGQQSGSGWGPFSRARLGNGRMAHREG